jgi:hypothetical protein
VRNLYQEPLDGGVYGRGRRGGLTLK